MMNDIFFLMLSYFIGAIPFGWLIGKFIYQRDITKEGSYNIGATNVYRLFGALPAIITLIADSGKAALCFIVMDYLNPDYVFWAGFLAIIGHNFSIFLQGRGGKGVAGSYGLMLAYNPFIGVIGLIAWVVVFVIMRYSSLSALLSWLMIMIASWVMIDDMMIAIHSSILTLFIVMRHRANITRLMKGEEPKMRLKK